MTDQTTDTSDLPTGWEKHYPYEIKHWEQRVLEFIFNSSEKIKITVHKGGSEKFEETYKKSGDRYFKIMAYTKNNIILSGRAVNTTISIRTPKQSNKLILQTDGETLWTINPIIGKELPPIARPELEITLELKDEDKIPIKIIQYKNKKIIYQQMFKKTQEMLLPVMESQHDKKLQSYAKDVINSKRREARKEKGQKNNAQTKRHRDRKDKSPSTGKRRKNEANDKVINWLKKIPRETGKSEDSRRSLTMLKSDDEDCIDLNA